jgi:hypothetical protein
MTNAHGKAAVAGKEVDHKNGNPKDNKKKNQSNHDEPLF